MQMRSSPHHCPRKVCYVSVPLSRSAKTETEGQDKWEGMDADKTGLAISYYKQKPRDACDGLIIESAMFW